MEAAFQVAIFIFSTTAIVFLLWIVFRIDQDFFSAITRERVRIIELERERRTNADPKVIKKIEQDIDRAYKWSKKCMKKHEKIRKISVIFVILLVITCSIYVSPVISNFLNWLYE